MVTDMVVERGWQHRADLLKIWLINQHTSRIFAKLADKALRAYRFGFFPRGFTRLCAITLGHLPELTL